MPDISRYEVREGEIWRKPMLKISMETPDISRYEAKIETEKSCPDSDLLEAIMIHKQLRTLPRKVLAYFHSLEESSSAKYSSLGDIDPLDDDD